MSNVAQPRVLVVDDDEALRSVLEYKLRRSGYTVECAADGLSGLELLAAAPADVLLLDLMMPRMDGFQVLRAIRAGSAPAPRAVIVMSARAAEDDQLKAFQLGAADFVTKPLSLGVLLARMRLALGQPVEPSDNAGEYAQ